MLRPWLSRTLLTAGLVALAVVPRTAAQPPAASEKATVTFRTPDGKVLTEVAEVKESAGRLELTYGKTKAVVNAPDVLKVEPAVLAGANAAEVATARTLEDGKDAGKAAASYADQGKKAGAAAPDRTKRYFAFKEAAMSTKVADGKTGADFDAEAKKAVEKWAAVLPMSRKGYEIWPAAKTTARLQAELNDFGKAAATLGALAGTPDLPKELRYEALLLQAAMNLRGRQNSAVDATVGQLEKDKEFPTGGPRDRLNVLKVAAKVNLPATPPATPASGEDAAKLQAAIDAAKDPVAKGIGYAALGELHLANGLPRDAMWAYLWVDVVYNQEHDDQVLAVARLAQLFDLMGDKDRADQFREKLTRVR